ncbi:MAG: hypothetical protein L3J69_04240 [Desulfobacula sp.]|nr:hypothetical protein [Desulfobacula sp.]
MLKESIIKIGFAKMLVLLLALFLFFSIVSSFILYQNLHTPLGPHFAAAQFNIINLQNSLLYRTIAINLIFFVITAAGLLLLGIFYSHRIAGPFIKINRFTKMLEKGKFNQRIYFRKKDVIHSLAVALNAMARAYEDRHKRYNSNLKKLEQELNSYKSSIGNYEQNAKKIIDLRRLNDIICQEFKDINL